jgi:hypothetical protein
MRPTSTNSVNDTNRSKIARPIVLIGSAALGNGNRVTIGSAPTTLGIPVIRLVAKNAQSTRPDIANTA